MFKGKFYLALAVVAFGCNNAAVNNANEEAEASAKANEVKPPVETPTRTETESFSTTSPQDFAYSYAENGKGEETPTRSWNENRVGAEVSSNSSTVVNTPTESVIVTTTTTTAITTNTPATVEEINQEAVVDENTLQLRQASAMRLTQLLEPAQQQLQTFIVNSDSVVVITGARGAKLYIDPAKLETKDGQAYTGPITVELIELQTTVDMLFAAAPTVSNGELLETGGSYYINCKTEGGEDLQMQSEGAVQLELPHLGNDSMNLFVGEKQKDGTLNWKETDDTIKSVKRPAYYIAMDYYKRTARRCYYDKATHQMVYEIKAYDEMEWKEDGRWKLNVWRRLTWNKQRLKMNMSDDFRYASTVPLDSSFTYKQLNLGRIFSRYRGQAKLVSGGIRPTTKPNYQYFSRKTNVTTTLHQIDNRVNMQNAYLAQIPGFGWINCDRLYNTGKRTEVYVNLPVKEKGKDETAYFSYIVFKSIKGILGGSSVIDGKIQYQNIPVGEEVVMVVMCEKDGVIMADVKTLNITKKMEYTVNLKPTTATDMRAMLETAANLTASR